MAVPELVQQHVELSEHAYDLWIEGKLLGELGIPDDGKIRVEIIGGVIVLSPGPRGAHVAIASDIHDAFTLARADDRDYRWRTVNEFGVDLKHRGDAYIPDLMVLSHEDIREIRQADRRQATAEHVAMLVEITSKSTAANDREPGTHREHPTKWNGYAHEGVEFYLLVDRDPRSAGVTLFFEPHMARGIYRSHQRWSFGETIELPDPFNIEIPTDEWEPWDD